jgi:soluble lytic murein transglycosylase-like protein
VVSWIGGSCRERRVFWPYVWVLASRGLPLVAGAFLFGGCATAGPEPNLAWPDGPIHDASAEWTGNRAVPQSAATAALRIESVPVACEDPGCVAFPQLDPQKLAQIARVQRLVKNAARDREIPIDLINGIIWVESSFEPRAVSSAGALGLMQLMPGTGREVAHELGRRYRPYDPDFNIHAGTYYFAEMLKRFDGNLRLALAAYNAGPNAVESWIRGGDPLPEQSRGYVGRVLLAARAFRSLFR